MLSAFFISIQKMRGALLNTTRFLFLVCNVRKKSDLSCTLDSCVELSLVLRASTGNSSGKDLSALTDELTKLCRILVVDEVYLICTENANLFSSAHHRTGRTNSCFCLIVIHDKNLLLILLMYNSERQIVVCVVVLKVRS